MIAVVALLVGLMVLVAGMQAEARQRHRERYGLPPEGWREWWDRLR